jgi:hypothetical protein
MKPFNILFSKTFYFWIIVRVIVILLFTASLITTENLGEIQTSSVRAMIYYTAFEIYIVSLVILLLQFLADKKRNIGTQIYAGMYSVYYSLLTGLGLIEEKKYSILILSFILLLYGIWQMFFDKKVIEKQSILPNNR